VTGGFAGERDAGGCVAGGWLTGGAEAVAECDGVVLDGVVVEMAAGCSATAPGAGPLADGRLLSTSRMTTTATTAVTAASGGRALLISRDAGPPAR